MTTDGWRPTPQLPGSGAGGGQGQWPPAPEPAHRPAAVVAVAPPARSGLSARRIALVVVAAALIAASAAGGYVAAKEWLDDEGEPSVSTATSSVADTATSIQTSSVAAVLPWSATPEDVTTALGTVTLTGTRWAAASDSEVVVLELFDATPAVGAAPDAVAQGQLLDAWLAGIAARAAEKGGKPGAVSAEPVNGMVARSQVVEQPSLRYFETVVVSGPVVVELMCAAVSDSMPQWCHDVLVSIVITPPAAP